jgi:hypothetical protein
LSILIVFSRPSWQKKKFPFFTIDMPPFLTFAEFPHVCIFLPEKTVIPSFAYSIVRPLIMIPGQSLLSSTKNQPEIIHGELQGGEGVNHV